MKGLIRQHEQRLTAAVRGFEACSEYTGRVVSWCTLGMVLATFAIVVLRYAFDIGWIAMQESVTWLHALVFMPGAAYTLKHDAHVRVDVFYREASQTARAWVDLLGTLLLLLPVCGFILWVSRDYVLTAWVTQESSRETGGLPGIFLLKTLIPVMAVLLLVQAIADMLRSLLVIAGVEQTSADRGLDAEI